MSKNPTVVLPIRSKRTISFRNVSGGFDLDKVMPGDVEKVVEVLQKHPFLRRLMLLFSEETFSLQYALGFAARISAVCRRASVVV